MICYMAFTIKGQTKATAAFKVNISVYGPISSKLCMHIAYWPRMMICYMAFTIKGQTKAAAAFKGNFGVNGPILFKICMEVAYWPPLMICYMAFTIKGQSKAKQRPQQPLNSTLVFTVRFHPNFACSSLLATLNDLYFGLYNQRPIKGHRGLYCTFVIYQQILFKLCVQVAYWTL